MPKGAKADIEKTGRIILKTGYCTALERRARGEKNAHWIS